jgi:hypothetical protein
MECHWWLQKMGWFTKLKGFKNFRLDWVFPVLTGIAGYCLVTGGKILWPANIAWLSKGDLAQSYLGWGFYRWSPWGFPLGASPGFGLEMSNCSFLAGTVFPLDLFFKALSPWLPEPFQYWGMCLLLYYILQAYLGWKLLGLFTENRTLRNLGGAFFLFAPPFLTRFGHISVCGHWAILAALYLYLSHKESSKQILWPLLLCVNFMISPELFAMGGMFWLADWAGRLSEKKARPTQWLREASLILIISLFALWQTGFFLVRDGKTAAGYGFYKMNLLSPIDSNGWSYLLQDIPGGEGEFEGFQYPGLGLLLLMVGLLPIVLLRGISIGSRRKPLLMAFFLLALFAITPKVGIGSFQFTISVPGCCYTWGNTFRGSGRFFWPVFYCGLLYILVAVIRIFTPRMAALIMAAALGVQVADTSAGWLQIRDFLSISGSSWESPMKSTFWAEAASRYDKIRLVQPKTCPAGSARIPSWSDIAYYALIHKKGTDAAYLARTDKGRRALLEGKYARLLEEGAFDGDSLYIFDNKEHFETVSKAIHGQNQERHLLAEIDGFYVFAPNYLSPSSDIGTAEGGGQNHLGRVDGMN